MFVSCHRRTNEVSGLAAVRESRAGCRTLERAMRRGNGPLHPERSQVRRCVPENLTIEGCHAQERSGLHHSTAITLVRISGQQLELKAIATSRPKD